MTISRNLSFLAEGVSSTGVLGVSNGGSGASTLTGYLYGNGTSAFTASTTIPTSSLSGTISNAQLANSSLTVNGTSISLGGSGTVTAAAGTLTGTTLNSTVVSSSLTSVGTLTSGTWNASTIGATYGGTGQNTVTTGDLLYGSASNTWSKLGIGSTGTILRVVGGVPTWGIDYTGTVTSVAASVPSFLSISGSPITTSGTLAITYSGTALPIANGGTGSTLTTYCNLTSNVTGTLPVGNGGTGLSNINSGYIPVGNGTSSLTLTSNLYFNTGSNYLGVNVGTSPAYNLDVGGYGHISSYVNQAEYIGWIIQNTNGGGVASAGIQFGANDGNGGKIVAKQNGAGGSSASTMNFFVHNGSSYVQGMSLFNSGSLSIGNTTDPGSGSLGINTQLFVNTTTSPSNTKSGNSYSSLGQIVMESINAISVGTSAVQITKNGGYGGMAFITANQGGYNYNAVVIWSANGTVTTVSSNGGLGYLQVVTYSLGGPYNGQLFMSVSGVTGGNLTVNGIAFTTNRA